MRNIAILIGPEPAENLPALLAAQCDGFNGQIVCVAASTETADGLVIAKQADVATEVLDFAEYRKARRPQAIYEEDLAHRLRRYSPDLVVLDGWNLSLSRAFMRYFPWRVITASQGLLVDEQTPLKLPDGSTGDALVGLSGKNAVQAVLAGDHTYTGSTVHVVLDSLDEGPVVARGLVKVEESDTVERLYARLKQEESKVLIEALKDLCLEMTTVT